MRQNTINNSRIDPHITQSKT